MTGIKIENIVVQAQVSEALDLNLLSNSIPNSNYNPDVFSGISVKITEPKLTVIVLSSGKVFCTGASNTEDAINAIKKVTNDIKNAGYDIKSKYEIKVENVIASTDFKKDMHLSSIATGLFGQSVEYEPEKFPALVYKVDDLCALLLLFSSGKLVCTGAKTIDNATKAINMMKEKLSSIGVL